MPDIIYKELSYKVNGSIFEAYNILGYGHNEKVYCNALAEIFQTKGIGFVREYYSSLKVGEKVIAWKYFDFFIEDKIILEVKTGSYMNREVFEQLFSYLKASDTKLGLIARVTRYGINIKRVLNVRR